MKLKYGLDETPPFIENLLLGFQWLAISVPGIVILGRIVGSLSGSAADEILYLQKLYFVTGLTLLCQVLRGHRLPLIVGPSSVLLIGIMASRGFSHGAVYGSVIIGGALLFLTGLFGLFGQIRRLFTPRVVASLLLLIAFTLTPAIMRLLTEGTGGSSASGRLFFAVMVVMITFFLYRRVKGIVKSTIIVWSMAGATAAYRLFFPSPAGLSGDPSPALAASFFHGFTTDLSLEPGVLISFLFCFFALAVNDLSSIQSISEMLKPDRPETRLNRGIAVTGLANALSGFFGIIGPVNFSLSPGVIMATGSASRLTLVPAAFGLLALSFSPWTVAVIGAVPAPVIGTMLLYILCYQVAAGFMIVAGPEKEFSLESGLIIGLPLLLGIIFSFLPEEVRSAFPPLLRPLAGNGFVLGLLAAMALEHLVFPDSSRKG